MRRYGFVLFILISISIVTLSGCGGGGGGGGTSVTPPETDLVGTYNLTGCAINLYTSSMVLYGSVSCDDFTSWSGTMKLGASSISQSFVIEGTPLSVSGTYTVTYTTGTTEGIFHIVDTSGTHDVDFVCSGNTLTTYSGLIYDPIWNEYFEEWDYWEKTSDALSDSSSITQLNLDSGSDNLLIGGIIGSLVE